MGIAWRVLLGRLERGVDVDATYSLDGETCVSASLREGVLESNDGVRGVAPRRAVRELFDALIASNLSGDASPQPAAGARLPALEIVIRVGGSEQLRASVREDDDPRFEAVADMMTAIDRVIDATREAELAKLRALRRSPVMTRLQIVRKTQGAQAVLDALARCAAGAVVSDLSVRTSWSWSIHETTTTIIRGDGVVSRAKYGMAGSTSETLGSVPLAEVSRVARALVDARFHELELPPREVQPTAPPVALAARSGADSISVEVPAPYSTDVPKLRSLLDLIAEVAARAKA